MKTKDCETCNGCPMQRLFPENNFVPAKLGTGTRLVIAEAPGEEEAKLGEPLIGGSGRWFNAWLPKAALRRDDLTLVNVINCRPPNNVFPTDPDGRHYISLDDARTSVAHCINAHVEPLLHGRKWTRIDTLGAKPLQYILGKTEGIETWRGSPLPVPSIDATKPLAIPTYHPAFIMRTQEMLPVAINDMRKTLVVPPQNYSPFPSLEQVKAFTATRFALDIETNMQTGKVTLVGLTDKPFHALAIPFRDPYLAELRRIVSHAEEIITQNGLQFDMPMLLPQLGCKCPARIVDIMLQQHLCFPDFPHDLGFIGSQFTNKPAWKHDKVAFEIYNCRDVDVTLQAADQLSRLLKMNKLERLYDLVQTPLAMICRLMHDTGFRVDPTHIADVRKTLQGEIVEQELKLPEALRAHDVPVKRRQLAPEGTLSAKTNKPIKYVMVDATERVVPWRQDQTLKEYIYGTLGIPEQLNIKTQKITVDKNALERLSHKKDYREHHELFQTLLALHKKDKLLSSFCKEKMLAATRMHPHFNVQGTASGRLSSSDPNLQNQPESIRYLYVPSHPGWKIVQADYSQIENRLTAYLAGDHERMARFLRDPNFSEHKYLASIFLGVPYAEVKKSADADSPYIKAKKIVHGTNYGEGAKKIALSNDLDLKEVKDLLARWKQEINATIAWQGHCGDQAKRDGFLTTPFGRKRWFYTTSYYTKALSFLPQSTAADVIFRAMIALMYERINWPLEKVLQVVNVVEPLPKPAQLLLQVHDALVIECPPELVDTVVDVLYKVMEQPWPELGGLTIPISVEVGDSWGECKKYIRPETLVVGSTGI